MNEKKPNKLLQKIFEVRRTKKIGLDKLAKLLRVKSPEAASRIENGINPLNANYLEDISKLLGLKTWELFVDYDAGEVGPLNDEEKTLILDFRKVPPGKKREVVKDAAKEFGKK